MPKPYTEKLKEEWMSLDPVFLEDLKTGELDMKAIADWFLTQHTQFVEELMGWLEGRKKTNCGCPPFESKHSGPCDDTDHSEVNRVIDEIKHHIKNL